MTADQELKEEREGATRILGKVSQAESIADAEALRQCLRNCKVALWIEQKKLGQEEASLGN